MVFKQHTYGHHKKEIKSLLRLRAKHKDRVRYHELKMQMHEEKRKELLVTKIPEIERKLDALLGIEENYK